MTSDNVFAPTLVDTRPLLVVKFNGNCLIRSIITAFRKVINLYISCTLNIRLRDLNKGLTWGNCLSWSVNLTKNATKIYQFKAKDSEIKPHPLFLGNNSTEFVLDNIKKQG